MTRPRLAVVFCTGRASVTAVVAMLARQLEEYGHLEQFEVSLVLACDPAFTGVPLSGFGLEDEVSRRFAAVDRLGPDSFRRLLPLAERAGVARRAFDILFEPRGYSSQRNTAIAHAVMHGAERMLLLDDDEYFVAPFANGGVIEWREQDVVGEQMRALSCAELASGAKTGYFSPVPSELRRHVDEGTLRSLGTAVGLGNEVVTEETFVGDDERLVAYGQEGAQPAGTGRAVLSAGNLGLSVAALRNGTLPPFMNPPGARGEDAIFATQLNGARLAHVRAYTFHDPFGQHQGITRGVYPSQLRPEGVTPRTMKRFCATCIGWVRYAPLWLRLTRTEDWTDRAERMERDLERVGPRLAAGLRCEGFARLATELASYVRRCGVDLDELRWAGEGWRRLMACI